MPKLIDFPPSSRWLISTDQLAARLDDKNLVAVDASYPSPGEPNRARAGYLEGHIPGAVFFDIDAISDRSSELPHTLTGPTHFGEAVGALGIGNGDTVVVYDTIGLYSAPRVWWTFRVFGAKEVFILDGGLPKWKAEGRPLEPGAVQRSPKTFHADMNVGAVATLGDVRMAVTDGSAQLVDARSAERFSGKAPEPRPGLRSGHMPGSFNVPFAKVVANGRLAPRAQIEKAFKESGVDLERPTITTCGSGITAAILSFALESVGKEPKGLYDGSWAEWGARPDVPVERD
ncbi:MAG: 3-mercaptopyruvate sulfurtransferase [Xanthobacteraceae bacterium]